MKMSELFFHNESQVQFNNKTFMDIYESSLLNINRTINMNLRISFLFITWNINWFDHFEWIGINYDYVY